MKLINHRCNSLEQLISTPNEYGVEIDIRNHGDKLILVHDPFQPKGIYFEEWLQHFQHDFLIINVKEEGLEEKILPLLSQYNISKYFILDESFPYIRKYALSGLPNFALRVSEFEDYRTALNLVNDLQRHNKSVSWVWADSFTGQALPHDTSLALIDAGLKICLVSPELHHVHNPAIWNELIEKMQEQILKNNIRLDMVCSKAISSWINFRDTSF